MKKVIFLAITIVPFLASAQIDLRTMKTPEPAHIYRTIVNKAMADFYWDPNSTMPDDSVMVVKAPGIPTGRFLRYFENYVLVDWFGAVPDDGIDDSYAIQKAINYAIKSSKAPEVRFSGGTYKASNLNIINKNNTEYSFVTLKIRGSSFLVGQATVLQINNPNGFGFHIMTGRQVEIENINFIGQSPAPSGYIQAITWSESQWCKGVRNNRFSPHSGIVIDGYHSGINSSDQYPGMSSFYTNTGTGGTSQVSIRNCSFKRLVVAILEGAAGSIANGDNIKASDCYFEDNKVAWGCGQAQSRVNAIENCYFIFHQFIVDGVNYGQQQGTPPNLQRCNFAGATKYLYTLNGSFSAITFQECYAESLFSLGKSAGAPVQFINCELMMAAENAFTAPHVAEGDQISFKGGRFGYFDNVSNMAIPFYVKNLSFDAVSMLSLPVNLNPTVYDLYLNKTNFDNCRFIGSGQVGDVWSGNNYGTGEVASTFGNSPIIMPGAKYIFDDNDKKIFYESFSPKIEYFVTDHTKLKIDASTSTAYFISSTPGAYQLNDVLTNYGANVSWSGDNISFTPTPTRLGQVYNISKDTIKIKYVPYGYEESTSYYITHVRIPHFIPKFFGDISTGSRQITKVAFGYMQPQIGNWIKGTGIPDGTRITNISGTTITLSQNATKTMSQLEFNDAKIKITAYSRDVFIASQCMGYSIGDVVYNNRETAINDYIDHWICKTSGFTNGSPAAQFEYVRVGAVNPVSDTWGTKTCTNDNNYVSTTDRIIKLDVQISANRTLTLPTPSVLLAGREIFIWNKNNTTNNWQFSGNVVDAAGAPIKLLSNNTWYKLICDGNVWSRTN